MAKIHPTAVVHASAQLAEDVEVGPHCLIEADTSIGPRCVLRAGAVVRRYTTLGADNLLDFGCVLGGDPQDLKFDPATVSYVRIGERNVFREYVTISRATTPGGATVIGNRTYWMVCAHAGHDTVVEDDAILTNGSALGGHSSLGRRAILSAHVVIHQFCWVGEMVMSRGNAGTSMHVPPYVMFFNINQVAGLNAVGLRRAKDITDQDRAQIKEAFRITYRSGLPMPKALEQMDACTDWGPAAAKFRDFLRKVLAAKKPFNRGLIPARIRGEEE